MSVRLGRTPDDDTCPRCGGTVTEHFRRVFGDRDGEIHGCTNCLTDEQLFAGAAAGLDVEKRCVRGDNPVHQEGTYGN